MDINELSRALGKDDNDFKFSYLEAKISSLEARFMQLFTTYCDVMATQKIIYEFQTKLDEVYARLVCLSAKESEIQLEVDRMNLIRRDINDMQENTHECIRKECEKIMQGKYLSIGG